jgi:glycosyltransferase involved in cell wall biosynthesis
MNLPPKPSIIFATPWRRLNDGWAIAARSYARAMFEAGVHINMLDILTGQLQAPRIEELEPEVAEELRPILTAEQNAVLDYYVWSGVLLGYERMKGILEAFKRQPVTVGYYGMFERRYIEPELAELLKNTSIWVPCRMNFHVLKQAGCEDVEFMPYPWFENDPIRKIQPTKESKRFYWIGRFEPRKAPENLLRAFMRAFKPGDARLTMKLSEFGIPGYDLSPEAVILDELRTSSVWNVENWRQDIKLFRDKFTRAGMVDLHAHNDIYVSSSRGEGIELGCWDAKQAGRRMIITESGGPEDFYTDSDLVVKGTGLCDAHPCYNNIWGPGGTYTDYDIESLIIAFHYMRGQERYGERFDNLGHKSGNVGLALKEWLLARIP